MEEILSDLNPEQRAAVTHGAGPLLVVAGAGTGKTRVLTRRIAWLIASKKARPDQVLGLTFSDKAAKEMEERVDALVPYGHAPVSLMTFHALGAQLFRDQALRLGLAPDSEVLSGAALALYLKQRLFQLPLKRFRPLANPDKHVDDLLKVFSRAKDEALSPEAWAERARALRAGAEGEAAIEKAEEQLELAAAYGAYDELLHKEGFIDHGDQLLMMLRIFREHPSVLEKAREAWPWVLVDEFQDTNTVQFELLKLLCPGADANITVVGDDDQAIYRFRGASLSNILEFRKAYPKAQTRVVTRNYRSRQDVLDCAHRLIQYNNPGRLEALEKLDKKLVAENPGEGQSVFYQPYDQLSSELATLSQRIQENVKSGKRAWRDHAVLVRSNSQAEAVINELNYRGIPSRFSGARGLYRREEVRHCLTFLGALARPSDDTRLFAFLIDKTYRVPVSDLKDLLFRARHQNKSLYRVLTRSDLTRAGEDTELDPEAFERVEKALTDLARFEEIARNRGVASALYQYLEESGMLAGLLAKDSEESQRQVANLAKFFERLKTFDKVNLPGSHLSVIEYLEALIEEGDDPPAAEAELDADAVAVSTVHMAKGLEWPVVFMVNLEDLHFPMKRQGGGLDLPEGVREPLGDKAPHLAEERRLFYVAMTRAREELYLSFSRDHGGKTLWKRSPFLQEALNLAKDEPGSVKLSQAEKLARHKGATEHPLLEPLAMHKEGEALKLSYYPIDDYLTCPLKYKIAHGLKLKPPPNASLAYGQVMHKAVQEFNRAQMEGRQPGIEELKAAYDQGWSSQGFYSREHEDERYANGIKRLEAFLEASKQEARPPIHIELPFEFRLGPGEVLVGRMDRVDQDAEGRVTICDYKTSNKHDVKKAQEEVKKSLQLAIYALAWKAEHGKLPDRLELYFLESGLREGIKPDEEYAKAKEAEIRRAFDGIRAGNFKATPGFNECKFCAYNRLCPESAAL